jgi:hypothetical protein
VSAGILLLLALNGWPQNDHDWLVVLSPVLAVGGVVWAVGLYGLVVAPFQMDQELRQRLSQFSSKKLDISASFPLIYEETGVPPYGWYILIPALQITNRESPAIDIDLFLVVRLLDHEVATMLTLENAELVNARQALPRGLQGDTQLRIPLRIEQGSRAVGFAGFGTDILPDGFDHSGNWLNSVAQITIEVVDGINNVQLMEYEVWPSIWPEIESLNRG